MSIAEEEREDQGSNEPTREQCLLDATGWQQRKLVIAGVLCSKAIALEDRFPNLKITRLETTAYTTSLKNLAYNNLP